jgi:hypothetical protein
MGYKKLKEYTSTYLGNIAERLAIENPGLDFTGMRPQADGTYGKVAWSPLYGLRAP